MSFKRNKKEWMRNHGNAGVSPEEKYKAVMDTQILAKAALKALDSSEEVKDAIKR